MDQDTSSANAIGSIPELQTISKLVDETPECLATGSTKLGEAALAATKALFDLSLASEEDAKSHINGYLSGRTLSSAPETRSQARKRKRSPSPPRHIYNPTPLTSLYTEGMGEDQIWSQLDLKAQGICQILELAVADAQAEDDTLDPSSLGSLTSELSDEQLQKALEALENGADDGSLAELLGPGAALQFMEEDDSEDDEDSDDEDEEEDQSEGSEEEEQVPEDALVELRDPSESEGDDTESNDPLARSRVKPQKKKRKGRRREVDDDFFDLDTFNAETEEAEAQNVSRGRLGASDDESDEDTGGVDLFAPVDDADAELEDEGQELFYKDFFDPPPGVKSSKDRKRPATAPRQGAVRFHDEVRVRNIKARGRGRPVSSMFDVDVDDDEDGDFAGSPMEMDFEDSEGEGFGEEFDDEEEDSDERDSTAELGDDASDDSESVDNGRIAMERVKDDLFAEDDDMEVADDTTTHEKRVADLRRQIAELEAENVGPKDWVLLGEADSRKRPQNSLLEEDLEFERVAKSTPVITEETVQDLEERIKARILQNDFDDVVRIRPVDDKPFLPSRLLELKDTKSSQSLAELYEGEYVAAQSGGVAGDDRDGKLKKEHAEIDALWEKISGQLDALCNAHFTPKQPKVTISNVQNVASTSMESALPTSASTSTMLAPEEVFNPASSTPRAKSELTPQEKRALRGKERKARQKVRNTLQKNVGKHASVKKATSTKTEKRAALESVVKGGKGVTVVGKQNKKAARGKSAA